MNNKCRATPTVQWLKNVTVALSCLAVVLASGCSPGTPSPDTPHGAMIGHWKTEPTTPITDLYISRASMIPVTGQGKRGQVSSYEVLKEDTESFSLDIRLRSPTVVPADSFIEVLQRISFSKDRQEMYVTTRQDTPGQYVQVREGTNTYQRVDGRTHP